MLARAGYTVLIHFFCVLVGVLARVRCTLFFVFALSSPVTPNTQNPTPNTQHPTPNTHHPRPFPEYARPLQEFLEGFDGMHEQYVHLDKGTSLEKVYGDCEEVLF